MFLETTIRQIISETGGSLLWLRVSAIRKTGLNLCPLAAHRQPLHQRITIVVLSSSAATRNNLELFANLSDTLDRQRGYRCLLETDLLNWTEHSYPFPFPNRSDLLEQD